MRNLSDLAVSGILESCARSADNLIFLNCLFAIAYSFSSSNPSTQEATACKSIRLTSTFSRVTGHLCPSRFRCLSLDEMNRTSLILLPKQTPNHHRLHPEKNLLMPFFTNLFNYHRHIIAKLQVHLLLLKLSIAFTPVACPSLLALRISVNPCSVK